MTTPCHRRQWLTQAAGAVSACAIASTPSRAASRVPTAPFRYGLNTSTIRGQDLPVDRQAEVAAQAGYDAIEPWVGDLDKFVQAGGSLKDLGRKIADLGLSVDSAIGFPEWIVEDDTRRARGLEEARRAMDLVRQIGGKRLAAPPVGATEGPSLDLDRAAARYEALLKIGRDLGVIPMIEVWGFSRNLRTLAQAAYVALASGQPDACVLADVYHLYKGGSPFEGLALLTPTAIPHFHVNDYPDIPRDAITDADRVFTGDGVARLSELFRILHAAGFRGTLSLELFNREYWKRDALEVAREGLQKMKRAVEQTGLGAS